MKTIIATGKRFLIDDEDFLILGKFKWYSGKNGYAQRMENNQTKYLHREIMGDPKDKQIDHINGDRSNNCRSNLRICNRTENYRNQRKTKRKTSSQYKGVSLIRKNKKWVARIVINYKFINLGNYIEEKEAALAYDKAARKFFGKYARTNF